ncbi:MAG: amino acid adenylation domain-containing protein [Paracoccaceae bacterium]|nr:amino acid adenylation domain-containing protein [Paracoccaceae bacterium]
MSRAKTTFLICSERSGSNLIRVMMDAHPAIAAPHPIHFLRDVVARADAMRPGDSEGTARGLLLQSLEVALNKRFAPEDAQQVMQAARAVTPFALQPLTRAVYDAIRDLSGKTHLFIKENNLFNVAPQVIDSFPDCKFVFQVRDPRDYLASAQNLKPGRLGNKFGSIRNALRIWADDQTFGLRMLGYFGPERVFLQRYEDLIARPEAVLRALCAFLDEPFEDAMLSFHARDNVQDFSTRKAAWENLSRPVMAGNARKYRQTLSRGQIRAVEATLGDLMNRFGYARDLPAKDAEKRWNVVWPSLLEPFERRANKQWSPLFRIANKRHHAALDTLGQALDLPYAQVDTHGFAPGDWPLSLAARIARAAAQHADRPAITIGERSWSYDAFFGAAEELARRIRGLAGATQPVVGIYAGRDIASYVGIIATVLAGGTYVPLNARFPDARNRAIVDRSGLSLLVHADTATGRVLDMLGEGDGPQRLPLGAAEIDGHSFVDLAEPPVTPELTDIAYMMFTSGSTGTPKGVPISHGNLTAYLDAATQALQPSPEDVFSQTFDLTFDLSVHDLFIALSTGARLAVASDSDLKRPADYIRREAITQWFSVPSLGYILRQTLGMGAGAFPTIRKALFCGEALARDLALDWVQAVPNGRVENWYGPTEATIACTRYTVPGDMGREGTTPIGTALGRTRMLVVDDQGRALEEGQIGRLLIGGPQVAGGYLNAPDLTADRFVALPGRVGIYYDTGDLAEWRDGLLQFRGRSDDQVHIRGYRIELGEIETALSPLVDGANAVVLAWPPDCPNPTHTLAVVETTEPSPEVDLTNLAKDLASYMIPVNVLGLAPFPKNASGKVDRKAIAQTIAARLADEARDDPASDDVDATLMAAIRRIKPALNPDKTRSAQSLLWAGLDSMDFVQLTLFLEERFGLKLDQDRVAQLANMPYPALVAALESGKVGQDALDAVPANQLGRANRALEFVRKAPAALDAATHPLVTAVGSSGTMRGLRGTVIRDLLRDQGDVRSVLMAGLPALNVRGITRICRYLRDISTDAGLRHDTILYELDPVIVSTKPPAGDIALDQAVFEGAVLTGHDIPLSAEFTWDGPARGDVAFDPKRIEKRRRTVWERDRDFDIADIYGGRVPFDDTRVAEWIEGAQILQEIAERVIVWIHPLHSTGAPEKAPGPHMEALLQRVTAETGLPLISPEGYELSPELFLDINHMAPGEGMEHFTRQLVLRAFL